MKLRYTRPALDDLEHVLDYIRERSPAGARKVHTRIKVITDLLRNHPRIGTPTDMKGIRRIATTPYPYLIFYEPTEQAIIIHAIRHGARDAGETL